MAFCGRGLPALVNHERFPGRDVLKSALLNGQTWFARTGTRVAELGSPAGLKNKKTKTKNWCRDWSSELCCSRRKSCRTDGPNISSFGHGRCARTRHRLEMEQISFFSASLTWEGSIWLRQSTTWEEYFKTNAWKPNVVENPARVRDRAIPFGTDYRPADRKHCALLTQFRRGKRQDTISDKRGIHNTRLTRHNRCG